MADERVRREERRAQAGDPVARRRFRRERIRALPDDVSVLLPDLVLGAWNALPEDERVEVAELFAVVLAARGRPMEVVDLRRFGPERGQPIARYRDRATGIVFALVPGGRFEPGLSPSQVQALVGLGEFDPNWPDIPRRGKQVEVGPFLMSVSPLSEIPGVSVKNDWANHLNKKPGTWAAVHVPSSVLPRALRAVGGALPTELQLEWATRGGAGFLFPWGDDLAFYERACAHGKWDAPETTLLLPQDPTSSDTWPLANGFGLLALGGHPVWCRAASGELRFWGGGGMCWPWQGCGEWLCCICGWTFPDAAGSTASNALRPVVPIGG